MCYFPFKKRLYLNYSGSVTAFYYSELKGSLRHASHERDSFVIGTTYLKLHVSAAQTPCGRARAAINYSLCESCHSEFIPCRSRSSGMVGGRQRPARRASRVRAARRPDPCHVPELPPAAGCGGPSGAKQAAPQPITAARVSSEGSPCRGTGGSSPGNETSSRSSPQPARSASPPRLRRRSAGRPVARPGPRRRRWPP